MLQKDRPTNNQKRKSNIQKSILIKNETSLIKNQKKNNFLQQNKLNKPLSFYFFKKYFSIDYLNPKKTIVLNKPSMQKPSSYCILNKLKKTSKKSYVDSIEEFLYIKDNYFKCGVGCFILFIILIMAIIYIRVMFLSDNWFKNIPRSFNSLTNLDTTDYNFYNDDPIERIYDLPEDLKMFFPNHVYNNKSTSQKTNSTESIKK